MERTLASLQRYVAQSSGHGPFYKSYQSKYDFRVVASGPGVTAKCREKDLDIDKFRSV